MESSLPARKSSPAGRILAELESNTRAWLGCADLGSLRCRWLAEESGGSSKFLLAVELEIRERASTAAEEFRGCRRRLTS